jgi:hypothetical protein
MPRPGILLQRKMQNHNPGLGLPQIHSAGVAQLRRSRRMPQNRPASQSRSACNPPAPVLRMPTPPTTPREQSPNAQTLFCRGCTRALMGHNSAYVDCKTKSASGQRCRLQFTRQRLPRSTAVVLTFRSGLDMVARSRNADSERTRSGFAPNRGRPLIVSQPDKFRTPQLTI